MLIGYARVSTDDQNLDLQKDALTKAGCEKIFDDYMSGARSDRPGLIQALEHCRKGDTLVIWRLDRLGRSMRNLLELADILNQRGIGLKSLHEAIDTSTANGKMQFQLFGMLAEFERNLLIERTHAGLAAARARGRNGGRPKLLDSKKQELAFELYEGKKHSIKDICSLVGIGKTSLYKYLGDAESRKLRESNRVKQVAVVE
jgi:DNA invertase Pin-like site-specific DNA recombinase